jgi:hypothetical protein
MQKLLGHLDTHYTNKKRQANPHFFLKEPRKNIGTDRKKNADLFKRKRLLIIFLNIIGDQ